MYYARMSVGSFFDKLAGAKADKTDPQLQVAPKKRQGHQIQIPYPSLSITKVVVLAVMVGASFILGAAYEKSQQSSRQNLSTNSTSGSTNQPSQSGGLSSGGMGGFGQMYRSRMTPRQVTAISSSSITVSDSSGSTNTYAIDSGTVITDNGQQVDYTGISTGDTVIILPNRTDQTTARRIIVNPDTSGTVGQPTTLSPGTTQTN